MFALNSFAAPEVLEVGQKRSSYTPAADLW